MNLQTFVFITKTLMGLAHHIPAKKKDPVLVVEDNSNDAHMIQSILKRIGVQSVLAPDPSIAKALITDRVFRMVILDVVFPKGNGIDFANEIYSDHPDLPVVFLTGHMPEVKISPGQFRTLSPGRVWVMCAKGVESGSLENALRTALKSANGVNGDVKATDLFVVAWLLYIISACVGFFAAYLLIQNKII